MWTGLFRLQWRGPRGHRTHFPVQPGGVGCGDEYSSYFAGAAAGLSM